MYFERNLCKSQVLEDINFRKHGKHVVMIRYQFFMNRVSSKTLCCMVVEVSIPRASLMLPTKVRCFFSHG